MFGMSLLLLAILVMVVLVIIGGVWVFVEVVEFVVLVAVVGFVVIAALYVLGFSVPMFA
jgi:hypothetical protein